MDTTFETVRHDVLDEHFTNIFRSGYISVGGTTLADNYKHVYKDIENFVVYDDDIWICSFPKTGTTWTQEMIWMIVNDFDFEGGQKCITERFPFLDYPIIFDYKLVYNNNSEFNPPKQFAKSIDYVATQKRPRLIKTHLPWNLLPKDIRDLQKHPKIVYITRNPKDTCISYFHHCKLIEGYTGNFTEFCDLFLSEKLCYTPFWNNVFSYWEKRKLPNLLFLKYEDLKSDLPEVIKKMGTFLSKELTDEQVSTLTHHLSFQNMKNNKGVNYEQFVQLHKKYKLVDCDGNFIRSGLVGQKLQLSQHLEEKFNCWIRKHAPNNSFGTPATSSENRCQPNMNRASSSVGFCRPSGSSRLESPRDMDLLESSVSDLLFNSTRFLHFFDFFLAFVPGRNLFLGLPLDNDSLRCVLYGYDVKTAFLFKEGIGVILCGDTQTFKKGYCEEVLAVARSSEEVHGKLESCEKVLGNVRSSE
ncbi:hypothetical protein FQR65_LT03340 [Abscondita terminalis]|nr:hypothetical protein FQR65_LT03340 [Abscondita terminalis]